ncbi:hypothetical protein [Aurantibacter sp.]|uniref:hypothetical protein n=1 Tax=Aurantibacter sp. TaxID=2807103 RepID=UPI0032658AD3
MRIISTIIFILVIHTCAVSYSQEAHETETKMTKEVKELIDLGEDAILKLALKSVGENVSITNFTTSRITTNGKEVYVTFSNQYKYLPVNSIFYFDVGVNLTLQTTYKSAIANPIGYSDGKNIPFFHQTETIKKHIDFVKEAISTHKNVDFETFEEEMTIRENEDYYAIELVSASQESSYKIKKSTGEIHDEQHAHLEPAPIEIDDSQFFEVVDFSEMK